MSTSLPLSRASREWRSTELLFRPIFPIQTIGRTQRPQTGARRQAQSRSEVLLQRIHINILDRFLPLAETILPPPPFSLSYQNPIGCPIAGAGKPDVSRKLSTNHGR